MMVENLLSTKNIVMFCISGMYKHIFWEYRYFKTYIKIFKNIYIYIGYTKKALNLPFIFICFCWRDIQ